MQMQTNIFQIEVTRSTPKKQLFKMMNEILPINDWIVLIRPSYFPDSANGGNPPKPLEIMVRAITYKHLYSISAEICEAEMCENLTVRDFVGISEESDVPDASTINRFHNFLVKNGFYKKMFEEDVARLKQDGIIIQSGTINDSTIIHASTSKRNKAKKRDEDAGWTKKAGNWHHGFKGHTGTDEDSGLIHSAELTAANVSDVSTAEKCLHGEEIRAFGDSGFLNVQEHIEDEKKRKIKFHVMKRRTSVAKMSEHKQQRQRQRERRIASIRVKCEHAFGVIKRQFGWRYTWQKGLEANSQTFAFKCTLANWYLLAVRARAAELKT